MEAPVTHEYNYVDLATRYEREVVPTKAPQTQKGNRLELKQLAKFFGNPPAPLNQITPQRVHQYLAWRKFITRANREKALLSHMFNMARQWGWTSLANPCAGIKGATEHGRAVYVEDDALELIRKCADPPVRNALRLAYLTGQRPADVISSTSEDISADQLVVTPAKTSRSTHNKIRIELRKKDKTWNTLGEFLETLRPKDQPTGKPYALLRDRKGKQLTYAQLNNGFNNAKELAQMCLSGEEDAALAAHIAEIQFRDIRAKAATDTAVRTGDIRSAQKQLGHASATMTEHYVRARLGDVVEPTK
jgi:integrase